MEARDYIGQMAAAKQVETIVRGILRRDDLTQSELDCVQMIYEALLRYDPGRIEELGAAGQLGFFAAGIARNMLLSKTSRYHYEIRRYYDHFVDIEQRIGERNDEEQ